MATKRTTTDAETPDTTEATTAPKVAPKRRKRGQGEGSIYQLPDSRWRSVVNLGYEWKDGKRVRCRKNIEGKTRAEVAAKLVKVQRDVQQGLPVANDTQTVKKFLTDWLEGNVKPAVRPHTYDSYALTVRLHIEPEIGTLILSRLTPQDVQRMMAKRTAANVGLPTVRYARRVLCIALNAAMKWGLVHRNVAALVSPPKVERHTVRPLTIEQAKQFVATARGDRFEAFFVLAVSTGLRRGEMLGLQWRDVDLASGTVTVRRQLQRIDGALTLVEPKTEQSRRTVNLPAVARAALTEHRIRQREERRAVGNRWIEHNLVFPCTIGTPQDVSDVRKRFLAILTRAKLPVIRLHDLRHSAASLMLAQGASAKEIQAMLGHTTISTTMDVYAHLMDEARQESARRMDAVFGTGETAPAKLGG